MDAQNNSTDDAQPKDSVSLESILRSGVFALRRRWLMLATIILVIFGAALISVLSMTPRYEAVTRIKIDPSQSAAMGQMSDQSSFPDQAIVDTEVTIMKSIDVARAVVKKLRLENDRELARSLPPLDPKATEAEKQARASAVAEKLLANISAQREKTTYIVELRSGSTDPVKAATIANTMAEQYIEASLDRRSGTAERQADFLTKQLDALSNQVSVADSQLAEYRARSGVVSLGTGTSSVIDQQIAPVAIQLATAQSDAAATAAKVRAAEQQVRSNGIGGVSAVLNSDVIRNLRGQRAALLQNLGEIQTRYGPKHPESQTIAEQLKSIDQQISDEAQRIISGLRADAQAASARAASLASDLERLRAQQAGNTRSSAVAETYERQATAAQTAYNRLAEKVQASDQAARSSLAQAQILEVATPPSTPSAPKTGLLLTLALLLAVAIGLAAVALLEIVSTTLITVNDVHRLGIPLLAVIPRLAASDLKQEDKRVLLPTDYIIAKPVGLFAEAFRTVRNAVTLGQQQAPRVVAVTSTLPDEGKTTTALSLARVMAMARARTLVIDADLRRAGLSKACGLVSDKGLLEVMRGEATLEDAIIRDHVPDLDILPLSGTLFSPEDFFGGDTFQQLLTTLSKRYKHILIDTPPFVGIADGRTIAKVADGVIVVIKWNATPGRAVKAGLEMLHHDGANVLGAVLSMVDHSAEAYGTYYSRKYRKYYDEVGTS